MMQDDKGIKWKQDQWL